MRSWIGSLLIAAAALPASAEGLSLREAAAIALEQNPQARIARASIDAAAARRMVSRAAWLPRVEVSQAWTRSDNPVFVFGSLLEQGRFGAEHFDADFLNDPGMHRNVRLGVSARYAVFDQFRRWDATREAQIEVEQADAASEEVRQRLRRDVIASFYAVAVADARREVAAAATAAAEADVAAIRGRFEQGLIVESDLLAAEVQRAEFRQQEIDAAGDAAITRASFNALLGKSVVEPLTIDSSIPEIAGNPVDLERALTLGAERRADLKSASGAAAAAALRLRTARGSFLPRLDAFASWNGSGESFADRNSDRAYGFVVTLDLFDGAKSARVAEARSGVESARASEDEARNGVAMEIVAAFHRADGARRRVEVAAAAVRQAEAAARIVRDRYRQGLTTITEQLHAETALVRARLDLLAARYDAIVGDAELQRATGGLTDVENLG